MAKWVVKLDPTAIFGGERTELDLSAGQFAIDLAGIDWGDAAIKAFMTEGRFGESSAGYRVPNRTITIPLGVGLESKATQAEEITSGEEARAKLGAKVGLLQREGGALLRQREGGQPLYADIVNATLNIPDKYGETTGIEPGTTLKLECLPDFYGEEITLDEVTGEGQAIQKLYLGGNPAVIFGDYPARCRIILTEKAAKNQRSLLWGFQSRHPWGSNLDALTYDAKSLTMQNGAKEVAGGDYSGKVVELTAPTVSTWHSFISTDKGGTEPLQHIGSFRVWARAAVWPGQRVRLVWGQGESTQLTENPPAEQKVAGGWWLLDLGEIRIEQLPGLPSFWRGAIQVETGSSSKALLVDRIWLQPVGEGGGLLRGPVEPSDAALYASKHTQIRTEGAFREAGSTYSRVTQVLGDLPRIPPSGLEGRQPVLFIKNSRGLTGAGQDAGKDEIKAVVAYRPCFIGRI